MYVLLLLVCTVSADSFGGGKTPGKGNKTVFALCCVSFTCVVKPCSRLCTAGAAHWTGESSSLACGRSEGHAAVKISASSESSPRSLQQVSAPRCHFIVNSGGGRAGAEVVEGVTWLV